MLMTAMRKRMLEDEAGQALVLGAFTMLILALSVMVTFQLGHAINERIRVQNAADNAAFSVSAAVARSLNFIAFANRAIISNYVGMMAFVTIASMMTALSGMLSLVGDQLMTIAAISCSIANYCQLCTGVPFIGVVCAACVALFRGIQAITQPLGQGLYQAGKAIGQAGDAVDKAIGPIVEAIAFLNEYAMYYAELAMKDLTMAVLASIAAANNFEKTIMKETAGEVNEGNTTGTIYNVAMAGFNAGIPFGGAYKGMFDANGSEKIPSNEGVWYKIGDNDTDARNKASILMAELTNGSRTSMYKDSVHWESRHSVLGDGAVAKIVSYIGLKNAGSTRITAPQKDKQFAEDNAIGTNGPPPTPPDTGACKRAQDNCKAKQDIADAAKPACTSAQNAYNTCNSSTANPPPNCTSQMNTMITKCNDYQSKQDDASDACDGAKDKCENAGGDAVKSGPVSRSGDRNYALMRYPQKVTMTRGSVIQASEWVKAPPTGAISGSANPRIFGIQTGAKNHSSDSYHCRYNDHQTVTIPSPGSCPQAWYSKPTKCTQESMHSWHGISRYVSFKVDNNPNTMFNQPDYWGLVNKSSTQARVNADLAFGINRSNTNADIGMGVKTAQLKNMNDIGLNSANSPFGGLFAGLNGWARSQVYYHRPNAWMEPPNLFNPFWRAKLAPIGPKIGTLLGKLKLPGAVMTVVKQFLVH